MNLLDRISIKLSSLKITKNQRIRAKFLDNTDLVKYYPVLDFMIRNKNKYEFAMRTLHKVATKEIGREAIAYGLCGKIPTELGEALRTEKLLESYKHWSGSYSCVITVERAGLCGIEFRQESMLKGSLAYYEARVELARHWLEIMNYVKNHYDNFGKVSKK